MNIVRIVQPPREEGKPDGPRIANGSKVFLSDGSQLEGVVSVEIKGSANSIWEATIVCHCMPPELEGVLAKIEATAIKPGVESTCMEDTRRRRYAMQEVLVSREHPEAK